MHPVIKELLDNNITVIAFYEGYELVHKIDGFYKSDGIHLREREDGLYVTARYNEITKIDSFSDLVYLNYRWWFNSKDKYDGWNNPEPEWLPLFIKYDLVVEKNMIRYIPNE